MTDNQSSEIRTLKMQVAKEVQLALCKSKKSAIAHPWSKLRSENDIVAQSAF